MALLGELSYALIRGSTSAIGNLVPDITIEEQHRDEVAITRHPVEGGAVITDHAYALPAELEIKCGYSNSTAGVEGYVQQQYAVFLALQKARKPFTVYTDKRRYDNMLVRGLTTVTDEKNKNVFVANVSLQQVLIVSTQTTNGSSTGTGSSTTAAGASGDQSNPANTGSVANTGTVETQGVGSQAFAGAYGPGSSLNPGSFTTAPSTTDQNSGSAFSGTIGSTYGGLSGFDISGVSPPPPTLGVDAGTITFTDPSTGVVVGTTPPYNPFEANPTLGGG